MDRFNRVLGWGFEVGLMGRNESGESTTYRTIRHQCTAKTSGLGLLNWHPAHQPSDCKEGLNRWSERTTQIVSA